MKNILIGLGLLLVGIAIGVGVTYYKPVFMGVADSKPQVQNVSPTPDTNEIKKQALAKYYAQISAAQDNQDWAAMYELVPQTYRESISKEQFVTHEKASTSEEKIVSQNTVVNSVAVNGDTGTVNRTIVKCLTKSCTGNDRKEDQAEKQYEYKNGRWQMPDPAPTEKSLTTASYIFTNSTETEQKKIRDDWGYGSDTGSFATKNLALYFDQNPGKLALAEAWVDKNKADRSRPVVNYQPPDINYQPPAVIERPVYQNTNTYNPVNCTSNTLGSYTYTNCY